MVVMYLQYCNSFADKVKLAMQLPFLFLRARISGKKLFESNFLIPVNGHDSILAFLLENPDDFVPKWFKEMEFEKQGIFLDIGCNLTFFSAYYTSMTGRNSIAFEINPQTAALVEIALSDSELREKIAVNNYGLSDIEGEVTISFDEKYSPLTTGVPANVGLMEKEHRTKFSGSLKAMVKTLDSVASEILHGCEIGLIKIDVEGMEPNVIRGSLKTIRSHKPRIIFESNSKESFKEVCAILRKEKYKIKELNRNNFLASSNDALSLKRLRGD